MASAIHSLRDLLVHELNDIYDAEQQIVTALPKLIEGTSNKNLSKALSEHLKVTKGQIKRLDEAFKLLGESPNPEPCAGMKGLIAEGNKLFNKSTKIDQAQLDAAIIGAAQKVEHYEISAYGSACAHCKQLGEHDCATLLEANMQEEREADELLSQLAEGEVNVKAMTAES